VRDLIKGKEIEIDELKKEIQNKNLQLNEKSTKNQSLYQQLLENEKHLSTFEKDIQFLR
jgi:hypothetical protein